MSALIQTLFKDMWIPHLKVKHIVGDAFVDNIGSQQVFLKNGFKFAGNTTCLLDMSSKGRTDNTLAESEWRAPDTEE